jgi:hypothetical protein
MMTKATVVDRLTRRLLVLLSLSLLLSLLPLGGDCMELAS